MRNGNRKSLAEIHVILASYEDKGKTSHHRSDQGAQQQGRERRVETIESRHAQGDEHEQGVEEQRYTDIPCYQLDIHTPRFLKDLFSSMISLMSSFMA